VDSDGSAGGTFVADRCGRGKEVGGAPRIGYCISAWSGGRTGKYGRH